MLDRPTGAEATQDRSHRRAARLWPFPFLGMAGLLGAAGVGVGAVGAHVGGGDVARTASEFLLLHAAAVVAMAGVALALDGPSALLAVAAGLLTLGAFLFGGELAFSSLLDWRPLPVAAPAGGLCLIAGWLCLSASAVLLARRAR